MTSRYSPLTKITRPVFTDLVPRTRLFKLLSGRDKRPVTWITGPGGSGKTSLVASYIDSRKTGCLWYQLDQGDADAATFFYYMGLAVRQAAPRFRTPLPLLTPEYRQGLAVFARRYFEELFRRLRPPITIVLDNYHVVPPDAELHELISEGLASIPEGIRFIITSRHSMPPAFSGLRSTDTIALLEWSDIRFTFDESRELVRLKSRKKLPADVLSLLHKQADGWAAGLILMMKDAALKDGNLGSLDKRTPEEVFDFFAGDVLARSDEETKEFLLTTAFLPRMTRKTARQISGRENAETLLGNLCRSHLFTEKMTVADPVYQYHPLFRWFLMDRNKQTRSSEEMQRLRRQAAGLLEQDGQIEDAVALYQEAQDWATLAPLILQHAPSLFAQGRTRTVREWLSGLPENVLDGNPWLLFCMAVCSLQVNPRESRSLFERAYRLFETSTDSTGLLNAWSGIVQSYLIDFDDLKPVDAWVARLDALVKKGITFPSPELEASVAAGMTGVLAWRRPGHPERDRWLNTALALPHKGASLDACTRAYTNCALVSIWRGEFAQAGFIIHELRNMVKAPSVSPLRRIIVKIAEAMLYNSSIDRCDEARQAVAEGLAIAGETGVSLMTPSLYVQGAVNAFNTGDKDGAREYITPSLYVQGAVNAFNSGDRDGARECITGMGRMPVAGKRIHGSHFFYVTAWHSFLTGDHPRALAAAKQSLQLIEEAGVPVVEALTRLLLMHVLHAAGDREEAYAELTACSTVVAQTGSAHIEYLRDATEAFFAFERNDRAAGRDPLRAAMSAGRRKGFFTMIYFWLPAVMSRLCAEAMDANIENDYARELVRKLKLHPPAGFEDIAAWPWHYAITTLGAFGMTRDGIPVHARGKAQKKPLQMLKALIAAGPQGLHKERLIDALWPDSEGDAGNIAFHTNLSRLRKLLGEDSIIQLHEGIVSLDRRRCLVDAWAFERASDRLSGAHRTEHHARREAAGECGEMRPLYEKAIGLYKGGFLADDADFPLALPVRERLRIKFLKLVSGAGQAAELTGDYERALDYYTVGLAADPLAEELHQGLISSCLSLGRKAEAMTAYQRCRALLASELGITPSPKTELLKQEILKS